MSSLDAFREEVHAWLDASCPAAFRNPKAGEQRPAPGPDELARWTRTLAERGYTVPTWPREYGGGGFGPKEAAIINEELGRIGSMNPALSFGTMMLGPVLLEFASHEQKLEHLPKIARARDPLVPGLQRAGLGLGLASLKDARRARRRRTT